MEVDSISLIKVKQEVTYEDEFGLDNSLEFEDNSKITKQEYHCKEEIDLEWDEKDNDYAETEPKSNEISREVLVKSEPDEGVQEARPTLVKTHKPPAKPNALPKLIKRCCPACDNLTEITASFLYRKKKCVTCSSVSLLFECAKCGKRYSHYDSVRYHVLTKCSPEEYHECPTCSYKTTVRSQLAKHVKRVHEQNSRRTLLKCTTCGKEFKYAYSLNRHLKKSCGLNFPKDFVQCGRCDRKFKDRGYLEEHEKVCRQEVTLRCDHCRFESKHKRRLMLHLRNKHFDRQISNN